jgi:abhydrolase domain-containing protein 14
VTIARICFFDVFYCYEDLTEPVGKKLPEDTINVDGLKIRYWTNQGGLSEKSEESKPTIVLFHGNAFSLDNWKKLGTLGELSKREYPTYAIDLPLGKGSKSDKLNQKQSKDPREVASWVGKIFVALDLPDKHLVIIGPSMGGGVALSYAIENPRKIDGLILIGPSIYRVSEDQKSKLAVLKMPILLLWGERDNVFPVDEYAKPLKQQLTNSKLIIIKGAGHAANLDKPGEFHELLFDFLSEIAS